MSTLFFSKMTIPAADMNGESTLPLLHSFFDSIEPPETDLEDNDGLFVGYDFVHSAFPYRSQDMYTRTLHEQSFDTAVLENAHLRAEFVPSLGGRLWSLYDKDAGRELLFRNPVFRPGYLATRNAWFSGGVEWNCGIWGHTPLTCSPMFTAVVKSPEGHDILRMYEYERIRGVVYQMDFWLPDDSKYLFCRMRIENPKKTAVAMYWWSNIAVPEKRGSRVVVPATETYTHVGNVLTKRSVPYRNGVDVSYPTNQIKSHDNFWNTAKADRKYISYIDCDGYGLLQTSTSLLKGRKLFVWGQQPGSKHWAEYLCGNGNDGKYIEIQAGLASTQYECLPMPPQTAWEWIEMYGPISVDPEKVHHTWEEARKEVETRLNAMITAECLESLLKETKSIALSPADKVISGGSGWGALENLRRTQSQEAPLPTHLDFGEPGTAQLQWVKLLQDGTMGEHDAADVPPSWMKQTEWTVMLEQAAMQKDVCNWYTLLQYGCSLYGEKKFDKAKTVLENSLSQQDTAWARYALGETMRMLGDSDSYVSLVSSAAKMRLSDPSFAKIACLAMFKNNRFTKLYTFIQSLPEEIQKLPRVKLYRAFAAVHTDRLEEADALLNAGEGLVVPDIKEGEVSMGELWYLIEEKKAEREGRVFCREENPVPVKFDFKNT